MDPIEKAIRAALERGNAEDMSFRQKIYRSAELALARSLSTRGTLDEATIQSRLAHLTHVTKFIETEFSPAEGSIVSADVRPEPRFSESKVSPPQRSAREPNLYEPRLEPKLDLDGPNVQPIGRDTGHGDIDTATVPYGRIGRQKNQSENKAAPKASNRLFRALVTTLVLITILALLVMLGWTAWNSSLFGNGKDNGNGPAKISQSESSSGGEVQQLGNGSAAGENWITIFEPKDASSVQTSDGLTAELRGNGADAYLAIANTTNTAQGEASFEIGRGVLEAFRGKKITFNIQARTIDGNSTQMATSCSLAGMGECQRVRFRLEGQLTENLIIMQLADVSPEASGTLSIMPDIDKTGNPVEIVGIRVRIEQ